jgi:hypothetical protein
MPRNEQEIRERAYRIWEEDGRPEGRDRDHWYRAEAESGAAADPRDGPASAASDGEFAGEAESDNALASGLQRGSTKPGGGPAAGAGSIGR